MTISSLDYMKLAISLAKNTLGQTSPNPVVGAVVVKNGEIVGMGAHLKAGEAHAEVHALQMSGEKAKDATIYVTLEPCSHYGRTPPCADLIIKSGIKRVVIATTDPNPKVAGKGIEKLKAAGLEVEVGLLKEEADELNEIFFHFIKTKTPYVTLKSAMSLDGKIATATGESKWITSEAARIDVHKYRHQHDAILVGVNTIIKDNPSLTTRLPNGGKNPIRIILDHSLRTPPTAKIVTDKEAETWIITSCNVDDNKRRAFMKENIKLIKLPSEKIEITPLLQILGENGITSLFVEGGATVNGSFLKEKCVQQIITYIAPKVIGGKNAPTSFGGEGILQLADALTVKIKSVEKIGDDLKIISKPY